jgi:hypothetical protein
MLDRLLNPGHILKCGPRSWRTKWTCLTRRKGDKRTTFRATSIGRIWVTPEVVLAILVSHIAFRPFWKKAVFVVTECVLINALRIRYGVRDLCVLARSTRNSRLRKSHLYAHLQRGSSERESSELSRLREKGLDNLFRFNGFPWRGSFRAYRLQHTRPELCFSASRENKIDARKLKGYIVYADTRPRN